MAHPGMIRLWVLVQACQGTVGGIFRGQPAGAQGVQAGAATHAGGCQGTATAQQWGRLLGSFWVELLLCFSHAGPQTRMPWGVRRACPANNPVSLCSNTCCPRHVLACLQYKSMLFDQ